MCKHFFQLATESHVWLFFQLDRRFHGFFLCLFLAPQEFWEKFSLEIRKYGIRTDNIFYPGLIIDSIRLNSEMFVLLARKSFEGNHKPAHYLYVVHHVFSHTRNEVSQSQTISIESRDSVTS
jgi:hypothetical protein